MSVKKGKNMEFDSRDENNIEYSTYNQGTFKTILPLNKCLESIQLRIERKDNMIDALREENRKLKEEHFKDDEMQKMKEKLELMREEYYLGFPISKEESEKVQEWQNRHDEEKHGLHTLKQKLAAGGVIGGRYYYEFYPTSVGTVGKCVCGACKESYTFQNI